MSKHLTPIYISAISTIPDLLHLVEEVKERKIPRLLKRDSEAVAVLMPVGTTASYIIFGEIFDIAFSYANPQAHLYTFHQFLTPFPTLDLNEPIMERFTEIRAYLRRRGGSFAE